MIKFYYHPSPNPAKVALFLEEAGLSCQLMPIDTRKGEQHAPDYLCINPNAKTPSLIDGDVAIFDSNAILLYLAEKYQQFGAPSTEQGKADMLSWMMFVATGIGPYSGQAFHFKHVAPKTETYAAQRYEFEAWRHWRIIDTQLASKTYMLGDSYTIVDMAVWGWVRALPYLFGDATWVELPHVKRWFDDINIRPAALRAEQMLNLHSFKAELDETAMAALYPHRTHLAEA